MTDQPPPAAARIFAPLAAAAARALECPPDPVPAPASAPHVHTTESAPDACCGSESCC